MSTTVETDCLCGSIGRTDLRQCKRCFHIWLGDKRLVSVGRVIRQFFPKPDVPESVMENARDRGDQVDKLFAAYVRGTLHSIPIGTRKDVYRPEPPHDGLLQKLMKWYDKQNFKSVQVQVVVGRDGFGGVSDFCFDGLWTDLKATYDVLHTHRIQVGGYIDCGDSYGGHVLHVTERYNEPRLERITENDILDWKALKQCWQILERRGAVKL